VRTVTKKKTDGDELEQLYAQLSAQPQQTLLAFARFLAHDPSQNAAPRTPEQPQLHPRPETESVVAGIKRLSASYPMLKKERLFGYTSDLMTQHMIQGRDTKDIIDDLEKFFAETYQDYCQQYTENLNSKTE